VHLRNDVAAVARVLLRSPHDCGWIRIRVRRTEEAAGLPLARHASIRPTRVRAALLWLKTHNLLYADVTLDFTHLDKWSEDQPVMHGECDDAGEWHAQVHGVCDTSAESHDAHTNPWEVYKDVPDEERLRNAAQMHGT